MNKQQKLRKENRQKLIAKLGSTCRKCDTDKNVRVYSKKSYEQKWMPVNGLYLNDWDEIEAVADNYYLYCPSCFTTDRKYNGVVLGHGEGKAGKHGCKCDLCRAKMVENAKIANKRYRDQARMWRELQKQGKV